LAAICPMPVLSPVSTACRV